MLQNDNDVVIDGKWGYSDVRSLSALTTIDGDIDVDTTDIDVLDVSKFAAGMNIWLDTGDAAEQCYLVAVTKDDDDDDEAPIPGTLKVARDYNGYTAAAHDDGTSIYSQRIEAPIRQSCIDLALRKHQGSVMLSGKGRATITRGLAEMLRPIALQITHYRRGRMKIYGL